MWHLERRHTLSAAVAAAQDAEKLLTDSEIAEAAQWASSAQLFADLLRSAKDSDDVVWLAYVAGLPIFEESSDG